MDGINNTAPASDGKKPRRQLADPPGDRIMATLWQQGDVLEYAGRKYIKMSRLMGRTMISPQSKRSVQLWLCIEASGQYPARTVVVPEILK